MFYWTVGGRRVVLTDDEERDIMNRAGLSSAERMDYGIATDNGAHAAAQRRVGTYLEVYAAQDPVAFRQEFVERRGSGPESLDELRALVEAYAWTTGRALWGWPADTAFADRVSVAAWLGRRPDAVFLTLTVPRRRWFRTTLEPVGCLAFPSAEIEHFSGTAEEFLLVTSRVSVRFGGEAVRVLAVPDPADATLP